MREKTTKLVKASPKDGEQDSTKESEKKSLKPCNFCGGLDHQRKSNRLCPFYNGGGENATTAIKDGKNVSKDGTNKLSKKRKASPKKKGKKKTPAAVSTSEDISKTNFIKLANPDDALPYKPVIDVGHPDFKPHETIFKVIGEDPNGNKIELLPTPHILVSRYYPRHLIENIVMCSNRYRQKRMSECPDLKIWKDKLTSK